MTTMSGSEPARLLDRLGDGAGLGDDLESRRADRAARRGPGGRPRGRRRQERRSGRCRAGRSTCVAARSRRGHRRARAGSRTMIRVPVPGSLSIASVPPTARRAVAHVREPEVRRRARPSPGRSRGRCPRSRATPSPASPRGATTSRRRRREWRAMLLSASRDDLEELVRRVRRQPALDGVGRASSSTSIIVLCRNSVDAAPRAPRPGRPVEQLGPQAEDEVADVADGQACSGRSPDRPGRAASSGLGHQVGHVLERQADGVDALDDAVVEVRLIRSRSSTTASCWTCSWSRAFSIAMPAWSANISTSAWSLADELGGVRPSRSGRGCRRTRRRPGPARPRNECIGGWFGGKPELSRVRARCQGSGTTALADDQAEQPVAARQRRRSRALRRRDRCRW